MSGWANTGHPYGKKPAAVYGQGPSFAPQGYTAHPNAASSGQQASPSTSFPVAQQSQVHQQESSAGGYNYAVRQAPIADPGKPSAAAQALYALPPAQQEKLSQILSQVNKAPGGAANYNPTQTGANQFGTQHEAPQNQRLSTNEHSTATGQQSSIGQLGQQYHQSGRGGAPGLASSAPGPGPGPNIYTAPQHMSQNQPLPYRPPPAGYQQSTSAPQPQFSTSGPPPGVSQAGARGPAPQYAAPPPMAPGLIPGAQQASSMPPMGPKAGYGSGYASQQAKQGPPAYGQTGGSQVSQAPSRQRTASGAGTQAQGNFGHGGRTAQNNAQGPRGGRGWGQGGSRPVGPATAGRASNAAAGGRGAVVGQSASMWRDLVDGQGKEGHERDSRRGTTTNRSNASPGRNRHTDPQDASHRKSAPQMPNAGLSRARHTDSKPEKDGAKSDSQSKQPRSRGPASEKHRDRSPSNKQRGGMESRKKDSEPIKGDAASAKGSQPGPEYAVKIAGSPFVTFEREYMDLAHRYTRMHIPTEFSRSLSWWTKGNCSRGSLGCKLISLDHPARFEFAAEPTTAPATPAPLSSAVGGGVLHSAKVALLCGLDDDAKTSLLRGPAQDGKHLNKLLKFVTVRCERDGKRSGITLLGGPVDPAQDGLDSRSEMAQTKACVRHASQQLGLDLSQCKTWIKFLEVHYQREPDHGQAGSMETIEVATIYLADAAECMPTASAWPDIWASQNALKNKEEIVKKEKKDEGQHGDTTGSEKKPDTLLAEVEQQQQADTKDVKLNSAKQGEEGGGSMKEESNGAQDQVQGQADVPWPPCLLVKGLVHENGERWRSACISLDGLLDYDEQDREEGAFEINLFAENFSELLSRDYGTAILSHLYAEREALQMQKVENSKREREASDSAGHGIKDPEEAEGKRRKVGTGESTPPLVPTAASTPSIAESAAGAPDQQPNPAASPQEVVTKAEDIAVDVQPDTQLLPVSEDLGTDPVSSQTTNGAALEAGPQKKAQKGRAAGARGRGRSGRGRGRSKKVSSASAIANIEPQGHEPLPDNTIVPVTALAKVEEPTSLAGNVNGDTAPLHMQNTACTDVGNIEIGFKRQVPSKDELLLAFMYFDRTGCGYLRVEDGRRILHNLGLGLSHKTVKGLCVGSKVANARRDKIVYKEYIKSGD